MKSVSNHKTYTLGTDNEANLEYRLSIENHILSSIELIINSNDIVDNDNSIVLDSVHTVIVKNMEGLSGQQLNCLCVKYPNADIREG